MFRRTVAALTVASCTLPGLIPSVAAHPGRPLLAPVALEARCPLAEESWDLRSLAGPPAVAPPVAKVAARPQSAPSEPVETKAAAKASEPATESVAEQQKSRSARPEHPFPPLPTEDRLECLLGEYLPYDLAPRDRIQLRLFPLALPQLSYLPGVQRALNDELTEVAADATPATPDAEAPEGVEVVDVPTVAACFPVEPVASEVEEAQSQFVLVGPPLPADRKVADTTIAPRDTEQLECLVAEWLWEAGQFAERAPRLAKAWLHLAGETAGSQMIDVSKASAAINESLLAALQTPAANASIHRTALADLQQSESVCCPVEQIAPSQELPEPEASFVASVPVAPDAENSVAHRTADGLDAIASFLQSVSRQLRRESDRIATQPNASQFR